MRRDALPVTTGAVIASVILLLVTGVIVPVAGMVATPPEEEPNDGRDEAQDIAVGETITGELPAEDGDWFAFTVQAGETINVTAAADTGRATEFGLFTPDGDNVGGERLSGERGTFGTTADSSGTYHVRAAGDSPSRGSGVYNFTVDVPGETLGLSNDRFERPNPPVGNQDRTNATDVGPGTYGDLAIVDDDRDVFAIDVNEGERVVADATFAHAENDLALALTDAGGTTVASANSSTDDERLRFVAPSTGTYYLEVTGQAGAATTYALDLTILEEVSVTVGSGSETVAPGNTTLDVRVTDVGSGLSGANLTFGSTNTSVVRIQSVAAGTGSADANVAQDGSSARANLTGLDAAASGSMSIATIAIGAVENGSATVSVTATVTAASGLAYPVDTVQGTTVTVRPPREASPYENDDGIVDTAGLRTALNDWTSGDLSTTRLVRILGAWSSGSGLD